jgi:transformer-2 protein
VLVHELLLPESTLALPSEVSFYSRGFVQLKLLTASSVPEPRRPFNDRYDDRRRGGYGGGYGREDPYRYRGYERRTDDRGGYERGYRDERGGYERPYREERGYDRRDRDEGYNRVDRYGGSAGSGREDRERGYAQRGPDERRGPGYDRDRGYDRPAADRSDGPRREPASGAGYGESGGRPEGREPYGGRD